MNMNSAMECVEEYKKQPGGLKLSSQSLKNAVVASKGYEILAIPH